MEKYKQLKYVGKTPITVSKKTCPSSVSEHFHEFYELELVLDGEGEYIINGKPYNIERGTLFFMTPFDFHSVKTTGFTLYNAMFTIELCAPEILAKLSNVKTLNLSEETLSFLSCTLNELITATNDNYISHLINTVLYKISSLESENASTPFTKSTTYILTNFRKDISLKEVADVSGYAESYFSTLFKKETGISFKKYLDGLRFNFAENLIKRTNYSILEICKLSGFTDYPNFIRRIKKKHGVSATELRNQYKTTDTKVN